MSANVEDEDIGTALTAGGIKVLEHNVLKSLPDLSEALQSNGMEPLPTFSQTDLASRPVKMLLLMTAFTRSLSELLGRLHRSKVEEEKRAEKFQRVASENKTFRSQVKLLKEEIEAKDRVLRISLETQQELTSKCDKVSKHLKEVKGEVLKLGHKVDGKDSSHSVALRRKDREIEKLEERLRGYVEGKTPRVTRSSPNDITPQEQTCRQALFKFETNNRQLVSQTVLLQDSLYKLHTDVGLVTWQYKEFMEKHWRPDDQVRLPSMPEMLVEGVFKMPAEAAVRLVSTTSRRYLENLQLVLSWLEERMGGTEGEGDGDPTVTD